MFPKKIFGVSFTFVLLLLVGQISVFSQKTKSYEQPKRLILTGYEKIKRYTYGGEAERFYPIGWSKDGKFAYYAEPATEECGCYIGKLVIQDLRTDKILWTHDFEGDQFDATEDEIQPLNSIKTQWKENQKLFSRKLAQYKIVANAEFTVITSSINNSGDVLTPKLELDLKPSDNDLYYPSKKGSVVLRMISSKMGAKAIYKKSYRQTDGNNIRTLELLGLFKSPFEPRVAVILVEKLRGHEDFGVTQIKIVGSHLTKGFK